MQDGCETRQVWPLGERGSGRSGLAAGTWNWNPPNGRVTAEGVLCARMGIAVSASRGKAFEYGDPQSGMGRYP